MIRQSMPVTWFVYGGGRRVALVPGVDVLIGRSTDCDIPIEHPRISRNHLRLNVADAGNWELAELSANGTFDASGRISNCEGSVQTILALGEASGPLIIISEDPQCDVNAVLAGFEPAESGAQAEPSVPSGDGLAKREGLVRLGRAADNDIVLPGVLASAHHAHFLRTDEELELIDLVSDRGTYVNGVRITRTALRIGDHVHMGGSAFVVEEPGNLVKVVESAGVRLDVENINVRIGEAHLLHDVSFMLPARSVLAVVGPSGSGKSTLLGAMTGFRPAESGHILVAGRDLYANYENLRFQVGLVPQADIVPAQLRVREALDYAAKLRLPSTATRAERDERVEAVMRELGLTERANLRIDRLSGGQRKRVSVALEMLTKPAMLFLDEPTSGLDPGLDRQVMMLLRELADAGRTVVVVTHSVENLALADNLLVLAAGGYVAYFGPPHDALAYFGVADMSSVFVLLDSTPGTEWARRWRDHHSHTATNDATSTSSTATLNTSPPPGGVSQFATLTARNIKVILADRTYAALLFVLPLVLAATGFLVGTRSGLGMDPKIGLNPEARLLLLVLILGSVFTGAATSIQELVKDRVIYQRERAVGLSRVAYISSKALVLGVIAAVQGFVFAFLSLVGRPGPMDPLVFPGTFDIVILVSLATVTSCMVGLLISGFLPTRDAALPALVIVTMVQVVFSGAIPMRFGALLDVVGPIMPGYWEFMALASSVDLDGLIGPDPEAPTWPHELGQWTSSAAVLVGMGVFFIIAAIYIAGRRDPGKKR